MKISKISVWQVDLPLHEGDYKWSGGKSVETFDTTVVGVETDEGVTGYGEACPLGPVYLPSYAGGVDIDVYIEQPCLRYEDCLSVRRNTNLPFVLDEVIDGVSEILRASNDLTMDVVNIKISKFGGLTRAKQARDLCISLGVAMTLEDTWGGDIVTAAISHLAHSTPTEYLFTATDFNSYVTQPLANGAPRRIDGRMSSSKEAGLGIDPMMDVLGEPEFVIQ